MTIRFASVLGSIAIIVGTLPVQAQIAFDEARFKDLKTAVIRIETEEGEGKSSKVGSGIILHVEGGTVLALTAKHVVESAVRIGVYFYGDALQTKWDAEVAFPPNFADIRQDSAAYNYDLVVLKIHKAESLPPKDIPQLLAGQDPLENDTVRAIGHAADNYWIHSADSRVVRRTDTNVVEDFRFPNTNVAQGFSGGPVFNSRLELVGMTVRIEPGNGGMAAAMKIGAILNLVQDRFRLTQLNHLRVPEAGFSALDDLSERYTSLSRRVQEITQFFDRRKAEVERSGGHLRGEITTAMADISDHLRAAKRSLDQEQPVAASRALDEADRNLQQLQAMK